MAKVIAVLNTAYVKGGETAQETLRIQTDALQTAFDANAKLVQTCVNLCEVVQRSAESSATFAKVTAERDIELAKIQQSGDFYAKLESLANGPVGQTILGKLGWVPTLPDSKKKSVEKVLERFFEHAEVCSEVQARNPEDYQVFLDFCKSLSGS